MPKGVYAAASAMRARQFEVDVLAHNMANSQTNGFKEVRALRGTFQDLLSERAQRNGSIQEDGGAGVFWNGVYRDDSNGMRVETGSPLDAALAGDVWFLVGQGVDQQVTRDGNWDLSPEGFLQTTEGLRVQGQGGPIQLPPEAKNIDIDREGRIFAVLPIDGTEQRALIDQIRVVQVEEINNLRPRNAAYFYTDNANLPDADYTDPSVEVFQGFLEESNGTGVDNMVQMLAAQRQYDSAQKALMEQLNLGGSYSDLLRGQG